MQFSLIIDALAILIPLFLSFSKTGKKKVKSNTWRYVIAIALYFLLKKWATQAAKDTIKEQIQEGTLNANAAATLYHQALNPSGFESMIDWDGTSEDLLFELAAKRSFTYGDAAKAFKAAYGLNLTDQIESELSSEDYKRFITILNS